MNSRTIYIYKIVPFLLFNLALELINTTTSIWPNSLMCSFLRWIFQEVQFCSTLMSTFNSTLNSNVVQFNNVYDECLINVIVITKACTLAELSTQQPCETWKLPQSVGPCARGLNLQRRSASSSIKVQVLNQLNTPNLTSKPILTASRGKGKRGMLKMKGGDAPR